MRKAEKVEEEEDMKTTKLKDLGIGERFILNDEVYIKTNHSSLEFNFDENGDYYEYIAWECVCTLPKCKFGEGDLTSFSGEVDVIALMLKDVDITELAQDALEHFGATPQICQTMEECAELIQALNKSLRHQDDPEKVRHNILEELADVTIMIEQMKLHFDDQEEFDEILEAKMDKLRSYLSEQEAD